ncbi:MAG: FtsW/RodA/SpoVE family cell cycle protein [bacterium]|nr:FtsW/RodA/SpoVE family cell cycle protein [bacterium]
MFSLFKRQDWWLNGAVFALLGLSLLMLSSIEKDLLTQQLIWTILGVILIFLFAQIDWRALASYRWIIFGIYVFSLLLLITTYFFAPVIRHTRSWLVLGPFQFQVSELVKVAIIIFFAYYFSKRHIGIAHFSNIFRSFIYVAIPAAFVFLQPDMGTMIVLLGLWVGFLLVSGLRLKHIAIGLLLIVAVIGVSWNTVLQDYQKERVIGLFQPNYDPLGINYSTIQSKIAIGSAGFFGKGYQQGTQVQLGFLPEAGTDFIFSAFIEEWGLFGGLIILGLFFFMIARIIQIGLRAENNFSRFICLGTALMFLIQFVINVGSATGLLPVIGLTFPFFSYGGSSILVNSMLAGIVQSTDSHTALS